MSKIPLLQPSAPRLLILLRKNLKKFFKVKKLSGVPPKEDEAKRERFNAKRRLIEEQTLF